MKAPVVQAWCALIAVISCDQQQYLLWA